MDNRNLDQPLLPSEAWYVVQTKPRGEATAVTNLLRQEFRAFCPRINRTRRHARKFTTVSEPLFPSYAFVAIDVADQPWRRISGTFGVARLLTDGERPIPLSPGFARQLRLLTDAPDAMHVGQEVRLRTGPFADLVGRVVAIPARDRVRVLLQIMNRDVSVEVYAENIYAIGTQR